MSTPADPKPSGQPLPGGAGAPVEPPSAPSVPVEDAGSQALADALSSSFKIIRFLMVVMVVIFALSGMFTVEQNEVAVKLRFGKPVGTGASQLLKPGWHWAFPYPIEEVVKIPVGQSHTMTSTNGWFVISPEMEARGEKAEAKMALTPGIDGYTLTADGNIIHVRTHLKYRISDPVLYSFRFVGATNLLLHLIDNAMFYTSARFNADAALYSDKARFQEQVRDRLTRAIADLQLGISIESAEVETSAPLDVQPKFEEVLTAQQDADTKVREAEGYASSSVNRAAGEAEVIRNNGVNSSNQLVLAVNAEAKYFTDQLPYYRANRRLFKDRLLIETRARVMTNAVEKNIDTSGSGELRLLLSREPQKPPAREQP